MEEKIKSVGYIKLYIVSVAVCLVCIVASVIISALWAGGVLAEGLDAVRKISFKGTQFSSSLKNALAADASYCLAIILLSMPLPVIPAIYIALRCVSVGITLGLAAKCRVMKDVIMISTGAFASNILTLPLYVLLFVIAVKYSLGVYCGHKDIKEIVVAYAGIWLKTSLVFALMCIAECIQMGVGAFVLGL